MLLTGLGRMQTDPVDTRLINYILEHTYRWVQRYPEHRSFWDPPFFYPARNVLAYSDLLLGAAPVYWAWRALGLVPDTAFQAWMISLSALNFAVAYGLLRRGFSFGRTGATAGAYLFAFASQRINELEHQQLLPHFFTLLCVACLVRWARPGGRTTIWILLACLAAVVQIVTSFYLGWFLVLALGISAAWSLVFPSTRRPYLALLRRQIVALGASGLLAAMLLAPFLAHYLRAAQELGPRKWVEVQMSIPDLRSWVYHGPNSWLYGWMPRTPVFLGIALEPAHRLGLGAITLLACLTGLYQSRRSPAVVLVAATGLTLVVCTTAFPREILVALAWAIVLTGLEELGSGTTHSDSRRPWCLAGTVLAVLLTLYPVRVVALALACAGVAALGARWLRQTRRSAAVAACAFVGILLLVVGIDHPWLIGMALVVPLLARELRRRGFGPVRLTGLVTVAAVVIAGLVVFRGDLVVWQVVYKRVPGASAIRAVARVGLMTLVPASVGLAVVFDRLGSRHPGRALALGLVCLLEQAVTTSSFDKHAERRRPADIASRIDRHCRAFFYSPEGVVEGYQGYQLDGMWASLLRRVPTVNGYSGHYPPGWMAIPQANSPGVEGERQVNQALAEWARAHGLHRDNVQWIREPLPDTTGHPP
jgi:hypothetical protein